MAGAEGQKLRWWQEEQAQKSHEALERLTDAAPPLVAVSVVPVAPSPIAETVTLGEEMHDTWAELEAEAVRRAEQAKQEVNTSVSFYMDKAAALVAHRQGERLVGWSAGGLIFLVFALHLIVMLNNPHYYQRPPNFSIFGGFGFVFFLLYRRRKWLEENKNPTIRLSPHGIFINTFMNPDLTVPWDEIIEVKARKGHGKSHSLEIRATKRRRFSIPKLDLPISPEALEARIATYETGQRRL